MKIPCKSILNLMVLTGCMIAYMLRINMAIAIVAMPDMFSPADNSANSTSTNAPVTTSRMATTPSTINVTELPDSKNTTTPKNVKIDSVEGYHHFDSKQQNWILGFFFWGYVITEIPGGRMSEVFGPRMVIGISVLTTSLLTLFIPVLTTFSAFYGLLFIRALQGAAMGAVFPAFYPLAAKWIPPMERSKFMSHLLALSLGAAVTYPLCGFLIANVGWRSVFYVTGSVGTLWSLAWFYLVYDSPSTHPYISPKERLHIEGLIGTSVTLRKAHPVPWKKLIVSGPVWAIILTHTANMTCYSTLTMQIPAFMKYVLHQDIKKNGIFSSLPQLGKYMMGISSGYFAYYLLSTRKLSTINVRRLFTTIATAIPGLFMLLQAHTGYLTEYSVFNLVVILTVNGACTGGHLCSGLDITPNFAGTIFGIANMLASVSSFFASYLIGHLTYNMQTFDQWQIIFWALSGIYFLATASFLIFGSATLQEWNHPRISKTDEPEGKPLKEIKRDS